MTVQVFFIPTKIVETLWPVFAPMVDKAAKKYAHQYDLDDVLRGLLEERSGLFGVFLDNKPIAAIIASPVAYPKRKNLLIELVGGNDVDQWWSEAIHAITEQAKAAGYSSIEARARKGWAKMAEKCNFKQVAVAYELEL